MLRRRSKERKYSRSKSISDKLLNDKNVTEKKPWDWEADEITGLGHKRVLKSVLIPETTVLDSRNYSQDPEYREEVFDWLGYLVLGVYGEVGYIKREFIKKHENWEDIRLNPQKYSNEGYPPTAKYTWPRREFNLVSKSWTEVRVKLPVDVYIREVLMHVEDRVNDLDIFPEENFPSTFGVHVKEWLTLLFRVMAIMLSNEHKTVSSLGSQLKEVLRMIIYIGLTWNILEEEELKCIRLITEPIQKSYYRDYQELVEESVRSNVA